MGGRSKSMKLFKVKIQEELNHKVQPAPRCPISMTPRALKTEDKAVKAKVDANHPVRKYGMELRSVKTSSLQLADNPPESKGEGAVTKKKRTKVQKEKNKEARQENGNKACTSCGTHKTAQWRAGPYGPKTLCNACGVRYSRARLGGAKPRTKTKKRKQDKPLPNIVIKRARIDGGDKPGGKLVSNIVVLKTNELPPCPPKEDTAATAADTFTANPGGGAALRDSEPESGIDLGEFGAPEHGVIDVVEIRESPRVIAVVNDGEPEPAHSKFVNDAMDGEGGIHGDKVIFDDFHDVSAGGQLLDIVDEPQLEYGPDPEAQDSPVELVIDGVEHVEGGIDEAVESGVVGTDWGDFSGGQNHCSMDGDGVYDDLGMELVDAWNVAEHIGFTLSVGQDPAVPEDTQAKLAGQLEATGFPGDEILHGLFSGAEGARVLGLAHCERGDEVRATLESINKLRFEMQGAEASAAAVQKVLCEAIDKMDVVREKLRDAIDAYHSLMVNVEDRIESGQNTSPSVEEGNDGY